MKVSILSVLHFPFKSKLIFTLFLSLWGYSQSSEIIEGAARLDTYLPLIKNKRIGIVAHASSLVYHKGSSTHLVDTLLALNQQVEKVFAPEHGFRSNEDNGATIKNEVDEQTGLPIISLYGKNKKPSAASLENIEVMLFDLQDVGVRFYTYLSTLQLVMEACAENKIPLIVLDRPNPNASYIDGPILEKENQSFVGLHPIPIVYGMTLGEFSKMINGEKWIPDGKQCQLTVIPLLNYTHQTSYELKVRPSPNLPNSKSINLYPSLCLFEQTPVSVGRGTDMQFQIFGNPEFKKMPFQFIPKPNFGAKYPKLEGKLCYGKDLRNTPSLTEINLKWLITAFENYPDKKTFFQPGFSRLAGTKSLEKQIREEWKESEIRESWQAGIEAFKKIRKNYLLYP